MWQSWLTMISQSPSNSTSKTMWRRGSRLIKIWGTLFGRAPVWMHKSKNWCFNFHKWKKNEKENLHGIRATGRTFKEDPITIIKSQSSLSIAMERWNSSGIPSPKKTISGFMIGFGDVIVSRLSWGCTHLVQSGMRCSNISFSISVDATRLLQRKQEAVANEPWHWMIRSIPACCSKVSMFWV